MEPWVWVGAMFWGWLISFGKASKEIFDKWWSVGQLS